MPDCLLAFVFHFGAVCSIINFTMSEIVELKTSMQELNYSQLQAAGSIDPSRIQKVLQSIALLKCSLSTVTAYSYFQSHHLFWIHNFRAFKLHKNVLGKVSAAGMNNPSPFPIVNVPMY